MAKKVLVIGGGPGGFPAALRLKELGAEVEIAESWDFGGTCLNRGCIPSKSFLDAAYRVHSLGALGRLAADGTPLAFGPEMLSWDKIKARRADVVGKLRSSLEKQFAAKRIPILRGRASFVSPTEAVIKTAEGELRRSFDAAIIAAGTRPSFPPPFAAHKDKLLDSDRIFDIPSRPKSLIIVGGGVIGLEFACFFNALGTEVHVVELLPNILPGEDETVTRTVKTSFEKRGVKFHLGKKTSEVRFEGPLKTLAFEDGSSVSAEEVLVGAGRAADLGDLGLGNIGLEWDRRGVRTDLKMRTKIPGVYAVGDVNGISLLAHSATKQGEIAAENIFGAEEEFDDNIVPKCVYSWPEVGSIGLTKAAAEAKGLKVKTSRAYFLGSGKALTHEETEGFVQIVFGAEDEVVLGAQIAGGPATELVHVFAPAVKFRLTRKDMKKLIYAHPTMAESIHEAMSK